MRNNKFLNYKLISAVAVILAVTGIGSHFLFKSHADSVNQPLFSVYQDPQGSWQSSASFAAETHTTLSINTQYTAFGSWADYTSDNSYLMGLLKGMPYRLELGIALYPTGSNYAAVSSNLGTFQQIAQNLVANGYGNAIIRLAWEFNIGTTPSQCQTNPTGFVSAWQEVVNEMRTVPGQSFKFEWNSVVGTDYNIEANCYPGDNYVDYISSDPYDQDYTYNPNNTPTQSATTWNNLTNAPYDGLNALAAFATAHNKPMTFAEWGVGEKGDGHGLGDDPNYVNSLAAWVKSHNVYYISYFNDNNGWDTVLADQPNSLAAYIADFGGSSTTTPPPTVSPPSVPTNAAATVNNANSVTVSWSASTDTGGPGLGGYNIFRNGSSTKLATVSATTTSFTDTTVLPSNSYTYTVQAFDTSSPAISSNLSTVSTAVTTPAIPKPVAPTGVKATGNSPTSVTVSWTASTDTGGPGISGYNVYRGGIELNSSLVTTTSYTDNTAIANTSYSYTVEAVDKSNNSSVASTAATITTAPLPDTTPPSTPGGVKATANSTSSITVTWNASTDSTGGGGIAGYYILRAIGSGSYTTLPPVTGTSYTDTGLSPGTTYHYEIEAYDKAGISSLVSTAASATTQTATVSPTAPAAPSGVTATAVSTSQINIAWNLSSDATSHIIYQIVNGNASALTTSLPSTVSSYGNSGLNASTSYSFYVVAYNGSTPSPNSATVSATTQTPVASKSYATGTIVGIAGKCLDNYRSGKVNLNKIDLYQCNGTGAQSWTYSPASGTITNSNGYCLDVYNNGTGNGTLVDLYQCNGTSAQVWSVKSAQGVAGAIISPHSGLCLDDKYSSTANGNQIWIYYCNGTSAQKWTVN